MQQPIVSIIDDDQEVITGLRWLIESVGYKVDTYLSAEPFLNALSMQKPNCLIVDIRMPVMSGIALYETLKAQKNTIPIIFITGHGDIAMAVHAMQEGAVSFLTKPINNQVLLEMINKAIKQDMILKIQQEKVADIFGRVSNLTLREQEVMRLMVRGKPTKCIAKELRIEKSTAESHRANVMKKMQVASLAELVHLATKYEFM
jgi:two-component system response regulator FixJ